MHRQIIKISHHPYYTRTEVLQPGIESQKRLLDRYHLHSTAKNTISGQQIFLSHFCSIFSRYQEKERPKLKRLEQQHFSPLFMNFVEIFALRSLKGQYGSCTDQIRGILRDLFHEKQREQTEQQQNIRNMKYAFMKNYLNVFFQQEDIMEIFNLSKDRKNYMEKAIKIENIISIIMQKLEDQLQKKLKMQALFNRMLQEQYCHDDLSHRQILKTTIRGFRCIHNMQAMRRTFKKFIWQEFQQICRHHMPVHIDLLSKQSTLETKNTIYLPSYSREVEPILNPLPNRLKGLHRSQPSKHILAEISKSIVQFCAKFHNNTKTFYPRISIRDSYMDMKKLVTVVSYNALLLDAIGLIKDTKSYQLKLATEPTPNFDFEETYLETDDNALLKLYRKYYEPFNHNQLNEEQANDNEKSKTYQQQLILLEEIHVGRLINVVYFIMNNRHFTQDYYKGCFSKQISKLLSFQFFVQSLKECYERQKAGQLDLEKIIPLPNANKIDQRLLPKTTLSFQKLTDHFGLQFNDDSLIQGLKSHRFKQQLYERHLVMKELTVLIFGKSTSGKSIFAFRKMPNPVKYLFLFFTENYEEIRYLLQSRNQLVKLSREIKGPKGYQFQGLVKAEALFALKKELNMDIYKVNILKEQAKKKKTKKDAYNKLQEYKTRNDSSGEFIRVNQYYLHQIQEINEGFELLYSLLRLEEDLLMEFQAKNSQLNYTVDEIDCAFASKDQTMDKLVQQVLSFRNRQKTQQSKEKLQAVMRQFKQYLNNQIPAKIENLNRVIFQAMNQFINTQIYQNFSKPQKLHNYYDPLKDNKPKWLEYCNYFSLRFKALTSVLLSFKPSNSRKYRNIFSSNLLDEKVSFSKEQLNSKTLGPSDTQLAIRRMEMIIEKCQHELQEKSPHPS